MSGPTLTALVVDDSAIYRRIVESCLREIPNLEVVGSAVNGQRAGEKAGRLKPDLVFLDVEMPILDGLSAIPVIQRESPGSAIVMVSSITTRSADVTIQALAMGAFDFVTKPQRTSPGDEDALRGSLRGVVEAFRESHEPSAAAREAPQSSSHARKEGAVDVVAIGISTGGPRALADLVPAFPANLAAPVLIVQHMPPGFTATLAASLDKQSALNVREAEDGQPLRAGQVLIAPGGRHLKVSADRSEPFAELSDAHPVNGFRPSVDVLFGSVAKSFGAGALCCQMTGMGNDGLLGTRSVRKHGGYCVAQDAASCAVFGMPRAVIEAGQADEVVALELIAARIATLARR